jgi:hypothetical protein
MASAFPTHGPQSTGQPSFSSWLEARVDSMGGAAAGVPADLLLLSQPPCSEVTEYPSMWAYGNHFRCENALVGSAHVSFDSGVACIGDQRCQSSGHDRNPVDATLKFVGVLRNIIRVEYASTKINVFKCAWVRPDVVGNRKLRKDEHGFWLVKFGALREESVEPYVFPHQVSQVRPLEGHNAFHCPYPLFITCSYRVHCSMQVFFAPTFGDSQWKVVLQKEARSKREEGDAYDGVLGAPGRELNMTSGNAAPGASSTTADAEEIHEAHVRLVDAERDEGRNRRHFEDYDWVDDDDNDDVREVDDDDWEELDRDDLGL